MKYLVGLVFAVAAFGQQWEIGGNIGYGIYNDGTIHSPFGTAEAGIRNRFATGIDIAEQITDYIGGQISYLYQDGHPFLKAPGVNTDIQGNSNAATFEMQFYFKRRGNRFRPFLSPGMGGKGYIIAGPAPFPQPIPQIASLTTNDVWKIVYTVGGGATYLLRPHFLLRFEFRDYITTFPRQQIVPAPHNTARGLFEQFTPLFVLSYTF